MALTRSKRQEVVATHVDPLLRQHADVTIRWFDAEAWSAAPSDILLAETEHITAWSDLFEGLRGTPLWTVPYFRVERIVPAIEGAFIDYEQRTGQRPSSA